MMTYNIMNYFLILLVSLLLLDSILMHYRLGVSEDKYKTLEIEYLIDKGLKEAEIEMYKGKIEILNDKLNKLA